MPDFFDRLIARGTQQPGPAVILARPRLPGPFERLADQAPDPFPEAVDEVREVDAARPEAPRARAAFGSLAGTQPAITPPPLLRDAATPRAPGRAPTVSGEQPPARPAPAQQAPLLPRATPVYLVADAGAAAPDQASARASRPTLLATGGNDPPQAPPAHGGPTQPPVPPGPRTLAVPASAVRAAADEARTVLPQPPAPPPVVVRIGRIEVRNWGPDRRERQPKRHASRAAPKHTLAAYLAAANGGRNGSGVSTGGAR